MPRGRLTDISISKLPQSKARVTYWDEGLPAFGVRVGARRKTFIVILNGGRRIKLGNYPVTSLKEARRQAYLRLSDPDGGSHKADAPVAEEAVNKFIELHHAQSRPRWRKEQERLLTKHFLSRYKDVPLNRITTKDVLAVTDALRELPSEQLHAHRAMKTLFTWARKREMIPASPLGDLAAPNGPADRDRVLSDRELVLIHRAAQKVGYPFGHIVLLCIHTAMRRGEVGGLKRSYVTPEAITLPREGDEE
jgi:integrase